MASRRKSSRKKSSSYWTSRILTLAVLLVAGAVGLVDYLWNGSTGGDKISYATVASGQLEVRILDMGQADSILIRTQEKAALIDAGENDMGQQVLRELDQLGITSLDLVIGTHPHSDHIGGLDTVLEEIPVEKLVMPQLPDDLVPTTATYLDVLWAAQAQNLEIDAAQPGVSYDLGSGAVLTLLGPVGKYDDLNAISVVSRLDFGTCSFLFTGDATTLSEENLLKSGANLDVDILDVGHHGSNTSSSPAFLAAVSPIASSISCGANNSYGHPHAEVVERLSEYGPIFRTDLLGTILFTSDGSSLMASSQRGETVVLKGEALS